MPDAREVSALVTPRVSAAGVTLTEVDDLGGRARIVGAMSPAEAQARGARVAATIGGAGVSRQARAILRGMRTTLLRLDFLTDQEPVTAAIRSGDVTELRRVAVRMTNYAESGGIGGELRATVAAHLRGLVALLELAAGHPDLVEDLTRLLAEWNAQDAAAPARLARPPDRPVARRSRPSRIARCPHGPDRRAVGRPRQVAGVPALRAV